MMGASSAVEIFGVYFPAWIVVATIGLVFSYLCVRWLASRPSTRDLGQSGLFFVSLTLASAMALWWAFFSGW